MIPAHPRYTSLPNANKLYTSICCALSERTADAGFSSFDASDWPLFLRMAHTERVAPLLYKALQSTPDLPAPVLASLHQSYLHTAARNTLLFHELDRVLQALSEANIPVIVLKGAALAQSLYGDIGLRPMNDLDLLVPAPRLDEATRRVTALGYTNPLPEAAPGLNDLLSHHDFLQKVDNPSVNVELHHTLVATKAYKYAAEVEWFWGQVEEYRIENVESRIQTLNHTAHLLYLAAHLMLQHGGGNGSLLWLVDIDRLVRSAGPRLDWTALVAQSALFGWSAAVRAALVDAHACLATPLPDGLLERLDHVSNEDDTRLVALKGQFAGTRMLGEYKKLSSLTWSARLRLLWALVFPNWEYMRWRYGLKQRWQMLVYYPVRWVDVLGDGFTSLKTALSK